MNRHECRSLSFRACWPAAWLLLVPASVIGATFPNACRNSIVPTQWDQITVSVDASALPSPAVNGNLVTLDSIVQAMSIPPSVFVAAYNLGLMTTGANIVGATAQMIVDATGTTVAQQTSNSVDTTVSTTVSDPDGIPGTGDEAATAGSLAVSYDAEAWTASANVASFREHVDTSVTSTAGGGVIAVLHLAGGFINVQYHCTPGTVTRNTPAFTTGPIFATTDTVFADGFDG